MGQREGKKGCGPDRCRRDVSGPAGALLSWRTPGKGIRRSCAVALLLAALAAQAWAGEASVLKGKVSDADGRAVEGARVFAYDDQEVRRPANFMSAPTDVDGIFRMVLPAGKYWVVARLKKTEDYGPLMPGDKRSEPAVAELAPGQEADMDFTVADLKEARRLRTQQQEKPVKVSGRIVDEKGSPVPKAYAIAQRGGAVTGIPDYLSAWVDSEGRYTLYLPRGTYFIGGATAFPPGQQYILQGKMVVDGDIPGVDIVMKSRAGK